MFLKLLIIKSVRPGSNKKFHFRKVNRRLLVFLAGGQKCSKFKCSYSIPVLNPVSREEISFVLSFWLLNENFFCD